MSEKRTEAEQAAWLADKIVALGDYAKEAAAMLRRWPDEAACARAAMEQAAVIADAHNDPERSNDKWEKGYNNAAASIAAAIRSASQRLCR
jgi:hypothetical protein